MAIIEDRLGVYAPKPGTLEELSVVLLDSVQEGENVEIADLGVREEIEGMILDKVGYIAWRNGKKKKQGSGYINHSAFQALTPVSYQIPANFAGLEAQMVPTRLQDQLFRIVEVVEDEDCVTVTARHVWYDNLENHTLWKPTETTSYSCGDSCRNILSNAISPVASRVATDCTDTKVGKDLDFERKNLVEAFLDPEKGICAKFKLSLIRNNWDFYCLKEVGYDRGIVVQNSKNLLGVERKESIENLATRVCPIAKDAKGNIIWLNNNGKKYIDSQYIGDYSYPRTEIFDTGLQIGKDDVTEQNIQSKLMQEGQKRFSEDKVDLPEVEMTIEFLSLGDTEEYAQYRDLDKVYLYDILTIKDTIRGYDYSAQVIGVEHDILTGMLNSVTIGSISHGDGTRKIATWQVPEVSGENIRLKSITAGAFESGAIQNEDLGVGIISYAHIAEATINHLTSDSIDAVTAHIHEIIAGRITAEDIQAGSITAITIASNAITADKIEAGAVTASKIAADAVTAEKILASAVTAEKIAANAVTANKIAANAVTANKIAADSINADKIAASAISAINAKLGTADIADARIANADISFAKVKDLNAQSAYFGQAVIQEGLANKLYVPRLAVGYAQMVGATIGDLVIQASNGNYYGIDVDLNGNVTATQRTVTSAEIASGHTSDGRTLVLGTDILAEDLNTNNIYASHALMDEITANIINVDQLWARDAFIGKLMVTDISSNTYIQSTIGNWQSGSTITQEINSLSSRISQLGYGTIFYQATPPDPSGVITGDVWVEPIADNTWNDISEYTWAEIGSWTWNQVAGQYRMYVWDGTQWKTLYDNLIISELETEINQTAYAVTLKADKTTVEALSGQVTEFSAELEVQAGEISAAVSSVNAKAASYTRATDPSLDQQITLSAGDLWVKAISNGTWNGLSGYTWNQLADYTWDELLGSSVYTWTGTAWIKASDYGAILQNSTLIDQLDNRITLEAEARETLSDQLNIERSQLMVATSQIAAEVLRATTAEGGKIDKTGQYQTANSIVTEAVRQSGVNANANYIAKTTSYQTADSIVTEAVRQSGVNASNGFLAKTTAYQTADAIVTEAVRQAGVNAGSAYIAKTSSYQSATAIVNEAVRQSSVAASGAYIQRTTSYQTAESIVQAAESYTDNNAYKLVSGITIQSAGVAISGNKYIKLDVDANNYVHITNSGIAMKGSRVTVDGDAMWARDDIIVMNPNSSTSWRRSQSSIESHMSGKHDWVLVKAFYNASISYNGQTGNPQTDSITRNQLTEYGTSGLSFGSASEWFNYQHTVTVVNDASSIRQVTVQVFLANRPFTFSGSTDRLSEAIAQADVVFSSISEVIPANSGSKTFTFNSGHIGYNLCAEGASLYYYIYGLNFPNLRITANSMTATTDATSSRVPCTVYYYP